MFLKTGKTDYLTLVYNNLHVRTQTYVAQAPHTYSSFTSVLNLLINNQKAVVKLLSQMRLFIGTTQVSHAIKACKQRKKEGWQRILRSCSMH